VADRHRGRGGANAFASWTAEGFTAGLLRLMGRYAPPLAGLRAPVEWGSPARRELLGDGAARIGAQPRVHTFHRSVEEFAEFFVDKFGRTERTAAGHDRESGPSIGVASEYVEAAGVRAS
jgi:hypothetical protein